MSKVKSTWAVVKTDRKNRIVFIEDICDKTGQKSITNDAQNVLENLQDEYGNDWRVVYKDTDNEWWEIVPKRKKTGWPLITGVVFKTWNGLAWDILQR